MLDTNALPARRVLLVEDSVTYTRLLTAMMESADEPTLVVHHRTLAASLQELARQNFSAILLDLGLPDSFGLATLDCMYQHARGTPIVVLTGDADQRTAINAMTKGAQDYLIKTDVDLDKVWRALRYAMERARLQQEQSLLQRELIDSVTQEQTRIGRDLHDGLGQELSGLAMVCKGLAKRLDRISPQDAETAYMVTERIQSSLRSLRRVIRGLNPVELDTLGLRTAIANLCEAASQDAKIPCQFRANFDELDIDSETGTHLFRITQESVNNALTHGKPTNIEVTLSKLENLLLLHIQDDGVGCDFAATERGMGLRTMSYRANLIGAAFEVKSTPNVGTIARCSLPLAENARWKQPPPDES